MKSKTIYQVDAFTNEIFKGNPAGVMLLEEKIDSELMQNIAAEMNLSETAFLFLNQDEYIIRYFTPTTEVPLCGHATLASAHIIYELGLTPENKEIKFTADGGKLSVRKESDWITMNFPKYPIERTTMPKGIKEIVGFDPLEMYSSMYDWKIAIAETEEDIQNSNPNFEIMKEAGLGHLIITSKSKLKEIDFVVRCFAPKSGINEDPVTGSVHCALVPLWSEKTGKMDFQSHQISKRTGKLKLKLINNRVEISGKCVTVFKAEMKI